MRTHDHDGVGGTVYVLHFDPPYRHARHYIGWARDVDARLAEHVADTARRWHAPRCSPASGCSSQRRLPGTRYLARRLKRWHKTGQFVCHERRRS